MLAHGAGAGMSHRHMQALADAFEGVGIATLRFNFPFIREGRRRVDARPVVTGCIAQAMASATERSSSPVWLGGHSFGGRMASHAVLDAGLAPAGLIFCSFPLHPASKPATARAEHLASLGQPMLFLSGTRDALAEPSRLERVVAKLDRAELHWLDTADHGYRILKRTRSSNEGIYAEAARVAREFIDRQAL